MPSFEHVPTYDDNIVGPSAILIGSLHRSSVSRGSKAQLLYRSDFVVFGRLKASRPSKQANCEKGRIISANDLDRCVSFSSSGKQSQSATLATATPTETSYELLAFLRIARGLNLWFLSISWDTGQADIGQGGTADISQFSINLQTAFAFRCLKFL